MEEIEDIASREAFLGAVAYGSAISLQHINLLGEYDFLDESYGIVSESGPQN